MRKLRPTEGCNLPRDLPVSFLKASTRGMGNFSRACNQAQACRRKTKARVLFPQIPGGFWGAQVRLGPASQGCQRAESQGGGGSEEAMEEVGRWAMVCLPRPLLFLVRGLGRRGWLP